MSVPAGVVTVIRPVAAPGGTVAVICVAEFTVNAAPIPLNFTEVAPVKFVPLIVTESPTRPLSGENDVMCGRELVTVKTFELTAVPPGVVTRIRPVSAPTGTVAVIFVAETTVKVADLNRKVTEVTPVKFVPLMVTTVPTGPLVGVNEVIVGAAPLVTVKTFELAAVPPGVVTRISPVSAPKGTVAVIFVAETTVKVADLNRKVTEVAPVKFVPFIVTTVPTGPLVGENDVMVGAAAAVTVKSFALVAVPFGVVTPMGPVVALEAPSW